MKTAFLGTRGASFLPLYRRITHYQRLEKTAVASASTGLGRIIGLMSILQVTGIIQFPPASRSSATIGFGLQTLVQHRGELQLPDSPSGASAGIDVLHRADVWAFIVKPGLENWTT